MEHAITSNLYEYKKAHPLGDILLFDGHIDVLQRADVIEMRLALDAVLSGLLELDDPMVMIKAQGHFKRSQSEGNSAALRAKWAADILDEFGSGVDGKVLIHTGVSYSDKTFIEDISRDVACIVRVVRDDDVTEAVLQDDELHLPAQSSLSEKDVHRLCLGESVDGADQHLAAKVIESLPLESIVAIRSITRIKAKEEVLSLVKHVIDNLSSVDILVVVLREICRNNRQDLLPDLIAIAKTTDDIKVQLEMLKCCSKLYLSSFAESYADSNVDIPLDDEYSRRYLEQFKNIGGDFFSREGKRGIPCTASEEIFVDKIEKNEVAFLVEDRPGKPHAVWVFKQSDCGHLDSEYDVLLNLATLELYSPNFSLERYLSELNKSKPGEVIGMGDVNGAIDKKISFYRLAYCVSGGVGSHDSKNLMSLREKVLKKYLPLD